MRVERLFYAIAGAALLLMAFVVTSGGVSAQEPTYNVTAYYNSEEKEPYTWYTVSNTFGIQFYSALPYTVTVEWEFQGSGGETAQFCSGSKAPYIYSQQGNGRWEHRNCSDWTGAFTGISGSSGSGCATGAQGSTSNASVTLWGATCDEWTADAEGVTTLYANADSESYYTLLGFALPTGSYYTAEGTWVWRWYPSAPITQTEPITNYCSDGIEVISDPVYLIAGENWASDVISTGWDYIQARYTISNANEPAGRVLAGLATLNGKDWLWGPEHNTSILSVTIPSSIGYDEEPNGPEAELGVRNTYDPFYVVSACIVPYSETMVPDDCNLVNHSFTEDLPGWSTLIYDYLSSEEDGAISLDGGGTGLASQVVTLTGSFRLEVRARSGGTSSQFRFGGYELGYPFESQAMTETATSEYQIFSNYLYLNGRSNISLVSNDDDLIVDWVCLSGHDTSGLPWKFPIPECTFPTFDDHPEYSITEIGNWIDWLAQKIGELLKWVICQIFVALFTIANMILEAIRAIGGFVDGPDWPTLPDKITFDSVLEWLRQVYVAFFNWLGLNFTRFRNAIPTIADWFWSLLLAVLGWVAEKLLLPAITWLMEHVLEALGIGEDALEIAGDIWRDLSIFVGASAIEAGYEFESLMLLLTETASVFGVLITGFRGVATGTSELDFGENLNGLAAYLWRGVAFINETVSLTPLSALNIVALGVITIGLAQWTISRLLKMLERLS